MEEFFLGLLIVCIRVLISESHRLLQFLQGLTLWSAPDSGNRGLPVWLFQPLWTVISLPLSMNIYFKWLSLHVTMSSRPALLFPLSRLVITSGTRGSWCSIKDASSHLASSPSSSPLPSSWLRRAFGWVGVPASGLFHLFVSQHASLPDEPLLAPRCLQNEMRLL